MTNTGWRSLVACVALAVCPTALAQQTIFNVPSADVTEPGVLYLEHESQTRPDSPLAYWVGTHYAALGLGHHMELDTTLYNVSAPVSQNETLGVGFKSAWPIAHTPENLELKWTVGTQLLVSLAGKGPGVWAYSHVSGRIPKANTRLTAGLSGGTEPLFGRDTLHAIAGIEQPLTSRMSLLGDWYSGTHGLGLLTVGGSYLWPKASTTLFLGVHFPNSSRVLSKPGLTLELAKLF